MIKVLFICYGNICRSSAAEYIFKNMVNKAGRGADFHIESKGTSAEELGNGMYPPMARELSKHGIDYSGHRARRLRREDYDNFDYIIGMDDENMYNMNRMWSDRSREKVYRLLDFADMHMDVSDPWYTRDFATAYEDIRTGCEALLDYLLSERQI